jgi:predicted dehydrogenase
VKKFSELGYNILCEKPMATSISDCVAILKHVKAPSMQGKVFAICHVMRYSPYNIAVKKVIDSGVLGEIVDVEASSLVAKSVRGTTDGMSSIWSQSETNTLRTLSCAATGVSRPTAHFH